VDEPQGPDDDCNDIDLDRVTSREEFSAVIREFRVRHAARNDDSELSYKQIAQKSGYSKGTVFNYLNGKPVRLAVVHDLLKVFGASPEEIKAALHKFGSLASSEIRRPDNRSRDDIGDKVPPGAQKPALFGLTVRRRWVLIAVPVVTVGAGVAAFSWWQSDGGPPISPAEFLKTLPTAQPANTHFPPCPARLTHTFQFSNSFTGVVWVHYATPSGDRSPVDIKIRWGPKTWVERLTLEPGSVQTGQGGTIIAFAKGAAETPEVILTSSVPVCAVFGTAETRPLPVPTAKLEAKGWT